MSGWLLGVLPGSYAEGIVVLGAAALGFVAGALGPFGVLRGRSMAGDVLSHGTLPGVVLAFLIAGVKTPTVVFAGAAVSALLIAAAMMAIERHGRIPADSALGVGLSVSFALGIVCLTIAASHGDGDQAGLQTYLFGQAAALVTDDVIGILGVGGAALLIVVAAFRLLRTALFDPGFAAVHGVPVWAVDAATTMLLTIAVVLGVQVVGAILMVALLVAPTVAARQLTRRMAHLVPLAGLIGAACGALGALGSSAAEVPTGPVIVLIATAAALTAVATTSRKRTPG